MSELVEQGPEGIGQFPLRSLHMPGERGGEEYQDGDPPAHQPCGSSVAGPIKMVWIREHMPGMPRATIGSAVFRHARIDEEGSYLILSRADGTEAACGADRASARGCREAMALISSKETKENR
jgi:hypothetical protein